MRPLSYHWPQTLLRHLRRALPCSCALCGRHSGEVFCMACRQRYWEREEERKRRRCRQCALPLPPGTDSGRCGTCLRDTPAFAQTVAACDYVAPLDQLVLGLKFGKQLALAPAFAELMRDAVLRQGRHALPELLCAVPLGEQRLAERGYNQAWEIAKPLARHLGIALAPKLLQRTRETGAQTALHPDQRQKNVRHAFLADPATPDGLRGKHVGVVDDVMTTGATLQEIALELKRQGAAQVTNYIFARTPPH